MGKASRLRKTPTTKMSLCEFHSSPVQGKQTTGIIPHVPIKFSVLDDIMPEDEGSGSTRVEVCSHPQRQSVVSSVHQRSDLEDEEPSAIDKVAARIERLKALCPGEITPEERFKEMQAIEEEYLAIEQEEKRRRKVDQPSRQRYSSCTGRFACSLEMEGTHEIGERQNLFMEDAFLDDRRMEGNAVRSSPQQSVMVHKFATREVDKPCPDSATMLESKAPINHDYLISHSTDWCNAASPSTLPSGNFTAQQKGNLSGLTTIAAASCVQGGTPMLLPGRDDRSPKGYCFDLLDTTRAAAEQSIPNTSPREVVQSAAATFDLKSSSPPVNSVDHSGNYKETEPVAMQKDKRGINAIDHPSASAQDYNFNPPGQSRKLGLPFGPNSSVNPRAANTNGEPSSDCEFKPSFPPLPSLLSGKNKRAEVSLCAEHHDKAGECSGGPPFASQRGCKQGQNGDNTPIGISATEQSREISKIVDPIGIGGPNQHEPVKSPTPSFSIPKPVDPLMENGMKTCSSSTNREASKSSWANLFGFKEQIKPSKLKQFNVGLEENELKVPIEISKQGYTQWDYAIVGYFLDKWSSFHFVSAWAKKIWAEELNEVTTLDNGFYIFNLKNEEALRKILDGGPYYCGNRLILIKQWHPGMKLNKEEFSSIPIWVKLYNVPLELWSDEGLSYIASVIGKPLFLDEFTQRKSRLAFARICIEVQVEKDIPKSFKLNLGYGSPFEVKVEVPWSPKRCDSCKTFGHTTKACPAKPKEEIKIAKQQWQVKEHNEENEWQVVKKGKDKFTPKPKEMSIGTPQASSNVFDILQLCQDEERLEDKVEDNSKDDAEPKVEETKNIGKLNEEIVKQTKTSTPPLQATKASPPKSTKVKKKR